MRARLMRLGLVLAVLAALAVGGSGLVSAATKKPSTHRAPVAGKALHAKKAAAARKAESPPESSESTSESADTESDTDQAAQDAACAKAGVSGDNVQYDDATGTCSADSGADSGSATP